MRVIILDQERYSLELRPATASRTITDLFFVPEHEDKQRQGDADRVDEEHEERERFDLLMVGGATLDAQVNRERLRAWCVGALEGQ